MWMPGADAQGELRQGDLLIDLVVPKLPKMPLQVARPPGDDAAKGHQALVTANLGDFLVASQCCVIEQDQFVSLAPVRVRRNMSPEDIDAMYATVDDPNFVVRAHPLEEVRGKCAVEPGELAMADLTKQVPVEGVRALLPHFHARMTVEARASLRERVADFWGRPEQSDADALGLS